MENNLRVIVGSFEIPDELARELSDLLIKQMIRQQMLQQIIVTDISKYEEVEQLLVPITERIETIKRIITEEYVPKEFSSMKYTWSYEGYDANGNSVYIIESNPMQLQK